MAEETVVFEKMLELGEVAKVLLDCGDYIGQRFTELIGDGAPDFETVNPFHFAQQMYAQVEIAMGVAPSPDPGRVEFRERQSSYTPGGYL